jgi:hypothetical protein
VVSVEERMTNSFGFIKPLRNLHLGDSSATVLLMFLCLAANNTSGESFHSYASIAFTTGLAERTIRKALKKLIRLCVVSCTTRGYKNNNLYQVHYDKLIELAEQGKADRSASVAAEQNKKATRQQRWRDGKMTVSISASETAKPTCVDGKSDLGRQQNDRLARRQNVSTNSVIELANRTPKELEAEHISGSQDLRVDRGVTTDHIQELKQEVATLTKLKAEAISNARLADYQTYTSQLQEAQTRLNVANDRLYKAAMAAAA